MPEPVTSTSGVTQALTGTALAAFLVGLPAEVVLGAFAGAVIFVTSAIEYPIRRRLFLSLISFLSGLIAYKPMATVMMGIANVIPGITMESFERGSVDAAGAFVVAIIAVRVGQTLYHRADKPERFLPGGKDDDHS
ncbi:phage holin family protein [Pectobacterium araliae]|uniref:phage holin family protein n=1 Tax=Pectobacterium araliae TaxID=3073862 RepID=UPI0021C38BE7